ncbi:uncharacterized protein LOC108740497 isoform X2 [Agrilus planipennis]|uniref:Uncharacterized protein LOC108740497 isoform X2 n=1 Tax=Agrilus planipennis TaxID=224129 RepID=A0A1W4X2H2_AGRPL|nr:uncharacterized protein LOC108740497 isoform X2 [Agrilus planipennis]
MSKEDDVLELKNQILNLKKENGCIKSENSLLKVRIRKLHEEIQKKNKQAETLINPTKNAHIRRMISEKGVSIILRLKEENLKLQKMLLEKELTIKRLQNDLKIRRTYGLKPANNCGMSVNISQRPNEMELSKNVNIPVPSFKSQEIGKPPRKRKNGILKNTDEAKHPPTIDVTHKIRTEEAISPSTCSLSDNSEAYTSQKHMLLANILRDFEESNIDGGTTTFRSTANTQNIQGDQAENLYELDIFDTSCGNSHEEIKQLQFSFMEMLSEIKNLKLTMAQLMEIQKSNDKDEESKRSEISEHCEKESFANITQNNKKCFSGQSTLQPFHQRITEEKYTQHATVATDEGETSRIGMETNNERNNDTDFETERLKKYHKLLYNIKESSESLLANDTNEDT